MPKGSNAKYTAKQVRGASEAERRAWATVSAKDCGGKRGDKAGT